MGLPANSTAGPVLSADAHALTRVAPGLLAACLLVALIALSTLVEPRPPRSNAAAAPRHEARWAALPEAARATVSRTLGGVDRRFFVRSSARRLTFSDAPSGVTASFTRAAAVVDEAGLSWSLGLRSVGRGGELVRVAPVVPTAHANVAQYVRKGLVEWYVNGPLGLEQGFTFGARPRGSGDAPLNLVLGYLPSDVRVRLSRDRRSVALTRGGRVLLRYSGLFASDARGRSLRTWIETSGRRLTLRVDDRDAPYPVRVDPFVQAGKLTASDGVGGDVLGSSVAISGDTVVVGAPNAKVGANQQQGAAYVFVKSSNGWADATETAKLTASDGASGDQFGTSVAVSGATVVVGAPFAANSQGAAYVFVEPGNGWANATETAKLTASDGTSTNWFGYSVGVSGDTVVAGAPLAAVGANQFQGAAYVYVRPVGGWVTGTETAKLTASDGAGSDHLGWSVGISGATIVAGAPNHNQGATYVFVEPAVSGWTTGHETAKLTASDGAAGDNLGTAVGASGDTVVAGAPNATVSGNGAQGAAYAFVKPAGGWTNATETAKLTASDGAADDQLGSSVAISAGTIIAGARANSSKGAGYAFTMPPGGWGSATAAQDKLTASDGGFGDEFGSSLGVDNGTAVVGATGATISGQLDQGAAYVFTGGGGGGGGAQAPVNAGQPTITDTTGGTLRRGHSLKGSTGSWLNSPTSYAYQWQRCDVRAGSCLAIPGATTQTYAVEAADVGFALRIDVTASNAAGSADETSLPSTIVATQLTLAPNTLDFGKIAPGDTTSPQSVTVTNAGTEPLRILSAAVPAGPFAIRSDGCSAVTLQSGASCTVAVTFTAPKKPSVPTYSGALAITADNDEPTATASLSATTTATPIIFGRVLDASHSGRPVAGAVLSITSLDNPSTSQSVQTAADGSYASTPLPAGLYQIEVFPPVGTLEGASAVVRGSPAQQDFDLHAPAPLNGGVTFDSPFGSTTSGVPVVSSRAPLSFHIPMHIPTGRPNSTHVFAVIGGIGRNSGTIGNGDDVAGAEVFSVFYNAQGWPTRMSRILVGALNCGSTGGVNPCARLAAVSVAPGAFAAADLPRLARTPTGTTLHTACDGNGNYVPDKYADGHFHMIPNDKGGIDFVIPLADGSPERLGFLWQAQLPVPSPTGDPLRDTFVALTYGALNGAFNGAVPAFGYYNAAVGVLNGLAQLSDNPDPIEGGAQGANAAATVLITMLNAETHGAFYWAANIVGGDLNAVLPQSPSTNPPSSPCPPPSGGGGGGGAGGSGGFGSGSGGSFYVDPSGVVATRGGVPVAGATVTLTRSQTRSGRQRPVPSGSVIMAPSNRRNPDRTGPFGNFGWDVLPGYYQVSAHKHGCSGSAHTSILTIPPPFTNLLLRLRCPRVHRTPTRLQLRVIREGPGTTVLRATVATKGRSGHRSARRRLSGTVTFRIGRATLWSAALDTATGTAGFDVPALRLHGRFSAIYSGNALFAPSHATGH